MSKIVFKCNGETATYPVQPNDDIWSVIEEYLYIFWELSPAERDWERKARKENFALFEYCGVLHDVFAIEDGNILNVFAVAE